MDKANAETRRRLKENGIAFWQLGERWGCNEVTVTRRFRTELSPQRLQEVNGIIDQILQERKGV